MAKKENVDNTEVGGGLSDGFAYGASRQARETGGEQPRAPRTNENSLALARGYQKSIEPTVERRSVKVNILITPSLSEALDHAVKHKKIRSRNDLINYLLEQYFSGDNR